MDSNLKRYMMRIRFSNDVVHTYVEEAPNQQRANIRAKERYPDATEIHARRIFNGHLDNHHD